VNDGMLVMVSEFEIGDGKVVEVFVFGSSESEVGGSDCVKVAFLCRR